MPIVDGQLPQAFELVLGHLQQFRSPRVADPQLSDQLVNHLPHRELSSLQGRPGSVGCLTAEREANRQLDFVFVLAATFLVELVLTRQRIPTHGSTAPNLS